MIEIKKKIKAGNNDLFPSKKTEDVKRNTLGVKMVTPTLKMLFKVIIGHLSKNSH